MVFSSSPNIVFVCLQIMPSMRAMMTAGPALKKCNVAGYNCSYLPIDHPHAFDEVLFVLMHGTGVGFSVEPRYTEQLPKVAEHFVQVSLLATDNAIHHKKTMSIFLM
jgi:ribonucleoside-diphosphate reductase alpha chain